ncbi:MAG: hypothetical protein U1F24_00660 [Alphaproteobacteria bacterium]
MLIQVFPLLALGVIVYNILVLVAGDSSLVDAGMTGFLNKGIEIGLFSGGAWKFTVATSSSWSLWSCSSSRS